MRLQHPRPQVGLEGAVVARLERLELAEDRLVEHLEDDVPGVDDTSHAGRDPARRPAAQAGEVPRAEDIHRGGVALAGAAEQLERRLGVGWDHGGLRPGGRGLRAPDQDARHDTRRRSVLDLVDGCRGDPLGS